MQTISFIRSLMEFNKRVLYQGTIYPNKNYTIQDLKDKLFFNSVFISNMQEMFQKYDIHLIVDDYIECVGIYTSNVSNVIRKAAETKGNICITTKNSFEKRLTVEKIVSDQVMTQYYPPMDNISYHFISGEIYYISVLQNGYIAISFVDPRRSVYHDILKCDFPKYTLYWKSDDCVKEYIRSTYATINTIAVKVTRSTNKPYDITKVEYNGDTDFMKSIMSIFPDTALILSNPYLYTNDLERILEDNLDVVPPVSRPNFQPIDFKSLFDEDLLIEYPNDSFDEYLQFLSLASTHNDVDSIYLTLYRIGDNPAIFYILRDAVNNGIKVHVNVELFASGETINQMWAREMESAGMKVTMYAAGELKVHSKLTLIKFNNGKWLSQIGTGNYHTKTTTQYTDLSLITADEKICSQVYNVFKLLSGNDDMTFNKNLLVTRFNARKELIRLIDAEAKKGSDGYITIKCNALDDVEISYHLDAAAVAGCNMDLVIRGVCTWIPEQLESNVHIKSIVWDKLEHSRVFCFGRSNPTIYLGSLDLVTKKIDMRIETLVKVDDPSIRIKICNYLNRYITTTEGSWLLTESGMYIKE